MRVEKSFNVLIRFKQYSMIYFVLKSANQFEYTFTRKLEFNAIIQLFANGKLSFVNYK